MSPEPGISLPELTDELLIELRLIYHRAAPTRKDGTVSTHNGLQAVYEHLRTLTMAAPEALRTLTTGPADGPWDVLVQRKDGEHWLPVKLVVEATAAIAQAFPKFVDFGRIEFIDRDTGHLLVQRLPWEDSIVLHEGEEIVHELELLGYRVIVPPLPPELATPPGYPEAQADPAD